MQGNPLQWMRSRSEEFCVLDPEIERTLRRLRQEHRAAAMAEDNGEVEIKRALQDYAAPTMAEITSSIRKPTIQSNNFKLKTGWFR